MGFLDIIKAIFPKKPDKGQIYRDIYEEKTLQEVIQALYDPEWESFEIEKRTAIQGTYIRKLFESPEEEGGFGLKDYKGLSGALGEAYSVFASDNTLYQYGSGEDKRIRNYKLEFLKNCVKRGGNASSYDYGEAIRYIFPLDEDWKFTKAELRNENFPLYHPWVLEGDDPNHIARRIFITMKINLVRIITDEEQLEAYGLFKQVDGKVTDEYVTIEDFLEAKSETQLKRLFARFQTRDGEGDDLD